MDWIEYKHTCIYKHTIINYWISVLMIKTIGHEFERTHEVYIGGREGGKGRVNDAIVFWFKNTRGKIVI